jgi:hypothetical protein
MFTVGVGVLENPVEESNGGLTKAAVDEGSNGDVQKKSNTDETKPETSASCRRASVDGFT